ncbi:hypothetical protein L2E82_46717 [Cichorium intybus]|uniref:Uncharacterized protein n=1 Tax=Cichorium intybus TaxID=13427 RepID=A0ACB8YTY1_CICIN|nr:hypothetical protein L2E82_46717 [Cichorium intybus]
MGVYKNRKINYVMEYIHYYYNSFSRKFGDRIFVFYGFNLPLNNKNGKPNGIGEEVDSNITRVTCPTWIRENA